jgi:hypothetical protein
MTIDSLFKRAALAIGCALLISLTVLTAGTARAETNSASPSGASRFASAATPSENAVIDKAMARQPGGTRISATQVKWPDGVGLVVVASPSQKESQAGALDGCPAEYFCLNVVSSTDPLTWYTIPGYDISKDVYFYAWGECSPVMYPGCDSGIHMYDNNTGFRVWLEQYIDSGNELCIAQGKVNTNYNGPDDNDYNIYLSNNPSTC